MGPLTAPICTKRVPECPLLVCRPAAGRRHSRDAWDDCESSSSHDSHKAAHLSPDVQAVLRVLSVETPANDAARQLPARGFGQARSSLECPGAAAPAVQVSHCTAKNLGGCATSRLRSTEVVAKLLASCTGTSSKTVCQLSAICPPQDLPVFLLPEHRLLQRLPYAATPLQLLRAVAPRACQAASPLKPVVPSQLSVEEFSCSAGDQLQATTAALKQALKQALHSLFLSQIRGIHTPASELC